MLFLAPWPPVAFAAPANGRFEVYCDGIGIFLNNIDGAPGSGKLVFFYLVSFPPGTMGGDLINQGKWSEAAVFPDRCFRDSNCESIADGRVWIDGAQYTRQKEISGKYEIKLNGKLLKGTFIAKERYRKHPLRLCL